MCLFASTQEALIAKEDIKVFKIVKIIDGKYYTPFRNVLLTENPQIKDIRIADSKISLTDIYSRYPVREEGIHAYTNFGCAIDNKNQFRIFNPYVTYKIIEGTIPKGTYYWKGMFTPLEIAAKYIDFGLDEYKES